MALDKDQKKRLLAVLLLFVFLIAAVAVYIALVSRGLLRFPCAIGLLTGAKCPSCGLTRATLLALVGRFPEAFRYNQLFGVIYAYVFYILGYSAHHYIKDGKTLPIPRPIWLHFAFGAVIILFTILRNLL